MRILLFWMERNGARDHSLLVLRSDFSMCSPWRSVQVKSNAYNSVLKSRCVDCVCCFVVIRVYGNRMAAYEVIGKRATMEDRSFLHAGGGELNHLVDTLAIAGVCDGHNGDYVASFLQHRLPSVFRCLLKERIERKEEVLSPVKTDQKKKRSLGIKRFLKRSLGFPADSKLRYNSEFAVSEEDVKQSIVSACATCDAEIMGLDFQRQKLLLSEGSKVDAAPFAGSVALMSVMFLRTKGEEAIPTLCIANIGDCRAVLSREGVSSPIFPILMLIEFLGCHSTDTRSQTSFTT